jgi:hypothetical protein
VRRPSRRSLHNSRVPPTLPRKGLNPGGIHDLVDSDP